MFAGGNFQELAWGGGCSRVRIKNWGGWVLMVFKEEDIVGICHI